MRDTTPITGSFSRLGKLAAESLIRATARSTPARALAGAMHSSASTEALPHESGLNVRVGAGVCETDCVRPSQLHTWNGAA